MNCPHGSTLEQCRKCKAGIREAKRIYPKGLDMIDRFVRARPELTGTDIVALELIVQTFIQEALAEYARTRIEPLEAAVRSFGLPRRAR